MPPTNHPGLGNDNEVLVPAYIALTLNINEQVKDFTLKSNAENFGNKLDDVVIDIITDDGELNFALQLKHKENSSKVLPPTSFYSGYHKGSFNLHKYCTAYKTIDQREKYRFILYSNIRFDPSKTNEVAQFHMSKDDNCCGKSFFDTSGKSSVYKFERNASTKYPDNMTEQDYDDFFQRFALYTDQHNYKSSEDGIKNILVYEEQFSVYINFFRKWHRKEFTNQSLNKSTLNLLLFNIFLGPFLTTRPLVDNQENLQLLESAVAKYDITLVKKTENAFFRSLERENTDIVSLCPVKVAEEQLLRCAKDVKLIDRRARTIDSVTNLLLILYHHFHKPLVIRVNKESEPLVYRAMELYKMREMRIVLVGNEFDLKRFQNVKVFTNLKNVAEAYGDLYNELAKKCFLSLQGREKISLDKLINNLNDVGGIVEAAHLVQMMQKRHLYIVGEEKQTLPPFYVNRRISTYFFSLNSILERCKKMKDVVIIQSDDETIKTEIFNKGIEVTEIEDYLRNEALVNEFTVVVTDKDCFPDCKRIFENVNPQRHHHCFKMVEKDVFLLIMSTQNTFNSEMVLKTRVSIEETQISKYFNNPINVLCSASGSGKSTILKYLKNEYPSEWWIVYLDLKAHNGFFQYSTTCEQLLDTFLQTDDDTFESRLKLEFLKNKKIILLMDGLDELEKESINNVLQSVKNLSMMQCKVWLTTRQNLQNDVENHFNIFTIDLDELDEEQQREYIKKRLANAYTEKLIEKITEDIFKNVNVGKNRELLGIPLQLHIITQILLDDTEQYQNLNSKFFVLSNLYKIFIEGRYRHSIDKLKSEHPHLVPDGLDMRLQTYQIAALVSLFDEEIINELNLQWVFNSYVKNFLDKIREKDHLGIIVRVDHNYRATFEHPTFGEYFAARFIVDNPNSANVFRNYIFKGPYQNLLTFFNIMLAEDSPSHLSILYRDFDQIGDEVTTRDKGGRNLFHLIATIGRRHRLLQFSKSHATDSYLLPKLHRTPVPFINEHRQIKEFVHYILQREDPSELQSPDTFFNWTPLDYSLACGALYVTEEILNKLKPDRPSSFNFGEYYSDLDILFHSLLHGYPNLLAMVLPEINDSILTQLFISRDPFQAVYFPRLLVRPECAKPIELIELLLAKDSSLREIIFYLAVQCGNLEVVNFLIDEIEDVNFTLPKGSTPLIAAVENLHNDIVLLLLEHDAEINYVDHNHRTPLHYAVTSTKMVKLLLEKGADINTCDQLGFNALDLAAVCGSTETVEFLMGQGLRPKTNLLAYANIYTDIFLIKLLLDNGCGIDQTNEFGESVLHRVLGGGATKVQMFVLNRHPDLYLRTSNGDTVFHCVARNWMRCDEGVLQRLLDKVEDLLYVSNNHKETAFHLALSCGNVRFVKFSIENEKIDLEKINEVSPLDFALEDGRWPKEKFLEWTKKKTTQLCLPCYDF